MDVDTLRRTLGLDHDAVGVLTRLVGAPEPAREPELLGLEDARALLAKLGVAEADRDEILEARSALVATPELTWLLQRCHAELVQRMGEPEVLRGWPTLPSSLGPIGRYFYAWVFLAACNDVRAHHSSLGVPDTVSWPTLAEMGLHMSHHRAVFGSGGLHTQEWLTGHFGGVSYRIGDLLFERRAIWFDAPGPRTDRPRRGEMSLGIHIPRGSLSPSACDAALDAAATFFARHYPAENYRFGTCISWLLDPQLSSYLSPASNILRFQRRFELLPCDGSEAGTATAVEMIYERKWPGRDGIRSLPQRSSLDRAIAAHVSAGGDFYYRTGWLRLPAH